ncbi:Hypothetical predicted protein [Marmota monax]|uniref:Uncharacterized protein n=1 Tax=Marmota monax TaxID=9995 RepID=A0A5E4B759_MARMO|nr:hypothetical protein GHT09_002926 [Marmota monax]VTJ64910.1 Hypothetical predicted protein [Marmota monax]
MLPSAAARRGGAARQGGAGDATAGTRSAGTRGHSRGSLWRRHEAGAAPLGALLPGVGGRAGPVTERTRTTSAFVISCRPVGFRMKRGARRRHHSFPRLGEKIWNVFYC